MYNKDIINLMYIEQGRIPNIDEYLTKILNHASFIIDYDEKICRGFIAYYCNKNLAKVYITMVLVRAQYRGLGIGKGLVEFVLNTTQRNKEFLSCELEVDDKNEVAYNMYKSMGFKITKITPDKTQMEKRYNQEEI